MNSPRIFPLLEKRKQIIFHFKISVVNTENAYASMTLKNFQVRTQQQNRAHSEIVQTARKGPGTDMKRTACWAETCQNFTKKWVF